MAKMTEKSYKAQKAKLLELEGRLEEAIKEQQIAQAAGDLSENEEYATARVRTEELTRQKQELEMLLNEAEITAEDRSPRITIGSVVDVCPVDDKGNPKGDVRRFTVEEKGDTILQGILSVKSSLGKQVINGTSGIYRIPDNGGISYAVKKVVIE